MSNSLCPQCGAPSGFLTQGQLCVGCDVRYQTQMKVAFSQLEAQRQQAIAIRQQEREAEEQKIREYVAYLSSLPSIISDIINSPSAIAEVLADMDGDRWLWLRERTPTASATYREVRQLLLPRIGDWWKIRDSISPSTGPWVKVIARSLLYTDLEGIRIAKEEVPEAIRQAESDLGELLARRDRTKKQHEKCEKHIAKATTLITNAKAAIASAAEESQKPIDLDEVAVESNKILTTIGISGKASFVIAGLCLPAGFFPLSALAASYGIYRLWKAKKMRGLSVDEFNLHLEQQKQKRIEQITKARKDALEKASTSLAQYQKQLEEAEGELKKKQNDLLEIEPQVVQAQDRIKDISNEMLRGRIDPLLKSILDS